MYARKARMVNGTPMLGGRPIQGAYRVGMRGRSPTQRLIQQFQQAHESANNANNERYNQILSGYDQLRNRTMQGLQGIGTSARIDIDRMYQNRLAQGYQSMVNRGMGNASTLALLGRQSRRDASAAYGQVAERAALSRANADMRITGNQLGVMERRNDVGPNPAMLMQLMQQLGRSGGGYGAPRGTPIGQPIGLTGGQLQGMYQQGLGRFASLGGLNVPYQGRRRGTTGSQLVRRRRTGGSPYSYSGSRRGARTRSDEE